MQPSQRVFHALIISTNISFTPQLEKPGDVALRASSERHLPIRNRKLEAVTNFVTGLHVARPLTLLDRHIASSIQAFNKELVLSSVKLQTHQNTTQSLKMSGIIARRCLARPSTLATRPFFAARQFQSSSRRAADDDAAFSPDKTRPEEQQETAAKEAKNAVCILGNKPQS